MALILLGVLFARRQIDLEPGSACSRYDHDRSVAMYSSLRAHRHDCFAIDVGSNFDAHTLVMLELGARLVSIEPQIDLCVASRISASALGYADIRHIARLVLLFNLILFKFRIWLLALNKGLVTF